MGYEPLDALGPVINQIHQNLAEDEVDTSLVPLVARVPERGHLRIEDARALYARPAAIALAKKTALLPFTTTAGYWVSFGAAVMAGVLMVAGVVSVPGGVLLAAPAGVWAAKAARDGYRSIGAKIRARLDIEVERIATEDGHFVSHPEKKVKGPNG